MLCLNAGMVRYILRMRFTASSIDQGKDMKKIIILCVVGLIFLAPFVATGSNTSERKHNVDVYSGGIKIIRYSNVNNLEIHSNNVIYFFMDGDEKVRLVNCEVVIHECGVPHR